MNIVIASAHCPKRAVQNFRPKPVQFSVRTPPNAEPNALNLNTGFRFKVQQKSEPNTSHSLEVSFGARRTPASKTLLILYKSRDSVNIQLPLFRDLLADKPVEGVDAIWSLEDWSEDVVVDAQSGRKATKKKTWDGEAEKLVF
ncbi:hypothetical protein B0H10DRAFT_1937612 [Mycena sp. CBHHK59/15]|nr:hypothetical protein B0H10DRAFT_1937612 [Mycena sp. CBHHK59/15]